MNDRIEQRKGLKEKEKIQRTKIFPWNYKKTSLNARKSNEKVWKKTKKHKTPNFPLKQLKQTENAKNNEKVKKKKKRHRTQIFSWNYKNKKLKTLKKSHEKT